MNIKISWYNNKSCVFIDNNLSNPIQIKIMELDCKNLYLVMNEVQCSLENAKVLVINSNDLVYAIMDLTF